MFSYWTFVDLFKPVPPENIVTQGSIEPTGTFSWDPLGIHPVTEPMVSQSMATVGMQRAQFPLECVAVFQMAIIEESIVPMPGKSTSQGP